MNSNAIIAGVGMALPPSALQSELWDGFFAGHYPASRRALAARIFANAGVRTRQAVVSPLLEDVSDWSTERRMRRYQAEAMPLGKEAVGRALTDAGITADEIGLFAVCSCTGYATPGLDILLARDLGMAASVQRLFVGHMGCYAALPSLGAAADFVVARGRPALLLCAELTSLHMQPAGARADLQQIVSHALFSDAAVAVVLTPSSFAYADSSAPAPASPSEPAPTHASSPALAGAPGPALADSADPSTSVDPSHSAGVPLSGGVTDPGEVSDPGDVSDSGGAAIPGYAVRDVVAVTDATSADHMTWEVTDLGFRMGLSPQVPAVLSTHVRPFVDELLDRHGLTLGDVDGWAVHPGGPKILDVVQERLELPDEAIAPSRDVLAAYGNCSSPTVLLVLDALRRRAAPPRRIVMLAFGPGLTLYGTLLESSTVQA